VRLLRLSGILEQDMPEEKSSSRWNTATEPAKALHPVRTKELSEHTLPLASVTVVQSEAESSKTTQKVNFSVGAS